MEVAVWCMVLGTPRLGLLSWSGWSMPTFPWSVQLWDCLLVKVFPAISLHYSCNADISSPSALAYVRRCNRMWAQARTTLLCSVEQYGEQTNHHRTHALVYQVGEKVLLSTWDLPLRVAFRKFGTTVCGSFLHPDGPQSISSEAPAPKVHAYIHPTFPMSKAKPVHVSPLAPVRLPLPPPRLFESGPVHAVCCLIRSHQHGSLSEHLVRDAACLWPASYFSSCQAIDCRLHSTLLPSMKLCISIWLCCTCVLAQHGTDLQWDLLLYKKTIDCWKKFLINRTTFIPFLLSFTLTFIIIYCGIQALLFKYN